MDEYKHISVLLEEAINGLNIKEDGIYVDCTFGGGGHSKEILKKLNTGHLYCFDQDDYALAKGKENLDSLNKTNYTLIRANFEDIKFELKKLGIEKVDGILYDLGVSSFQFDIGDRGFSYNSDAPLDMRMDTEQYLTAKMIVNEYPYEDLKRILYEYGEESFAPLIAKAICREREKKEITTTFELVEIIKKCLPAKVLRKQGHPAKQTFQALRIETNNELRVLTNSLTDSLGLLQKNGRIVVITFHSLEDRIVKRIFKEATNDIVSINVPIVYEENNKGFKLINNKVITPTEQELENNKRAHSAKMRIIEKTRD